MSSTVSTLGLGLVILRLEIRTNDYIFGFIDCSVSWNKKGLEVNITFLFSFVILLSLD